MLEAIKNLFNVFGAKAIVKEVVTEVVVAKAPARGYHGLVPVCLPQTKLEAAEAADSLLALSLAALADAEERHLVAFTKVTEEKSIRAKARLEVANTEVAESWLSVVNAQEACRAAWLNFYKN